MEILDVTPRDGLQDAGGFVPTAVKWKLLQGLQEAGYRRVEVTSFAHPRWIPMLQDAEAVYAYARRLSGVDWVALVPNWRGWERARTNSVSWITVVISASETHNHANLNRSRQETLAEIRRIVADARVVGTRVRGAVSTAFCCPFEGRVPPTDVAWVVEQLVTAGVDELSVADTLGTARPEEVRATLRAIGRPGVPVSIHLHDLEGSALANLAAAIEEGVDQVECGIGGLGGCPYAPGAGKNLAVDDVATVLRRYGLPVSIDLGQVRALRKMVDEWIAQALAPPPVT